MVAPVWVAPVHPSGERKSRVDAFTLPVYRPPLHAYRPAAEGGGRALTTFPDETDVSRPNPQASVLPTQDVNSRQSPSSENRGTVVNSMGTNGDAQQSSLTVDRETVRAYLQEMFQDVPGLLQIWTFPGKGSGEFFTTDEDGIEQAVDSIEASYKLGGQQSIYARITTVKHKPTKEGSRGVAADSQSFIALWTDIDFGTTGHEGKNLPPDAATAQAVYDASGLPEASITVHSGGGLYHMVKLAEPLNVTDDELRMRINALSRRWQYKVKATAGKMGYAYGTGVSDLARVLRIPGTINAKDWNNRRRTAYLSSGARYTLQELEDACPAPAKPTRPAPMTGEPAKDARARLDHHLDEMRATTFERNNALNKLAYMSFQYVGAGQLDEAEVEREFIAAGLDAGLEDREVQATVNSAKAGLRKPFVWRDLAGNQKAIEPEDMWAGQLDETGHVAEQRQQPPAPSTEAAPPAPPTSPPAPPTDPEPTPPPRRPVIDITNEVDGLEGLSDAVSEGCIPEVYVREGRLVHVTEVSGTHTGKDDTAPYRAISIDASAMRNLVGRHLMTTKITAKGSTVKTLPTKALCDAVLAQSHWPKVNRLRDVVRMPFVRADGTICQNHGYDKATGMWLACPEDLRPVPESPTTDDVQEARRLIVDTVLRDFPWVSDADRANYVALLFTPMLREIIGGLSPFGIVTAAAPSSGKTLLTDLIASVHGGRTTDLPRNDEELTKKITTFFVSEMVPAVTFDNIGVGHTLNSSVLAQLLTQRVWDGRILGRSESITRANDKLWMATGNNIQVGGDMRSRSILVRIDPGVERPEERDTSAFAVGNLDVWMRQPENRAHIVRALLVLVRSWAAAGMPKSDDEMRTYTPWAQTLGGLLAFHGIHGFRANQDELAEADEEQNEWALFLHIWHERHGSTWLTASQLLADYQNTLFHTTVGGADPWQGTFPLGPGGKIITPKSLGKRFQYYKGRPADGWALRYQKVPGRAALWRVEQMAPPSAPEPTPVPEPRTEPMSPPNPQATAATLDFAMPSAQRTVEVRDSINTLLRTLNRPIDIMRHGTEDNRQ